LTAPNLPKRPRLALCIEESDRQRALVVEKRNAELRACEARIEAARAEVFAAKDGVVGNRMTELEREWRRINRGDREGELMNLWAAIAPPTWIDRKRWRDAPIDQQRDVAIALASDVDGVEAAEAAAIEMTEARRIKWVLGTDGRALGGGYLLVAFSGDTVTLAVPPLQA
jgi:hypothetical protein